MNVTALLRVLVAAVVATAIAGCASGPKFSETAATMQGPKTGDGRVFFYRSSSMMGAAVQPDVRLNSEIVGPSKPGGFFFVDRPAGPYTAAASTETEKTVSFQLDAGEIKYIKMTPQFGVLVGRIVLSLESASSAQAELASLSYVGSAMAKGGGNASAGAPVPAQAQVAGTSSGTAQVAAPAVNAVKLGAGARLTYLERDAISQAPLGESTMTLVEISSTQRVYNDGALVTTLDGTPVKGGAHTTMIYGLGPRELARGGSWSGMFRAANILDDVPATFSVIGKQTKVVSGYRFEATRVRVEGYATRSQVGGQAWTNGAIFSGEALVDNASGVVLELNVSCRHNAYAVRRELVRVSGVS